MEESGARAVVNRARLPKFIAIEGDLPSPGAFFDGLNLDLSDHILVHGLINAHDHLPLNAVPCPVQLPKQPNSYRWIEAFQPYFEHPAVVTARAIPEAHRAWHGGLKNILAGTTTVAHHDPCLPVFDDPGFPVTVLKRMGWSHSLGLSSSYGPPIAQSRREAPEGAPWFIHLAEGTDDLAAGELGRLDAEGALGPDTVLVHGVALSEADAERIVEASAAVVVCPSSNLSMLGRTPNPRVIRRLHDAGRLALGTDSRFSGARDLLQEMKVLAEVSDLTPREIVSLVTTGGARILRLKERTGAADFFVLAAQDRDPFDAILQSTRASLRLVVHGGHPVIGDPDFQPLFAAGEVEVHSITLDGVSKLIAARLLEGLDPDLREPGLVAARGRPSREGP